MSIRTIAFAAVGLGLTTVSSAVVSTGMLGPSAYLSFADSPFNGGSFSYFHLENMEDHLLNTPGVSASAFSLSSGFGSGLVDSVDGDDGSIDGSGNAGEAMWSGGPITFTFDATALGNLPTHVGIVWTDGDNPITFTAYDENDVLLGTLVGSHADGNYGGGTAEDRFYGAINAGGIHKIVISSAGAIEVDHLQYGFGAVPEPATIAALGLGALSLLRKRRKK